MSQGMKDILLGIAIGMGGCWFIKRQQEAHARQVAQTNQGKAPNGLLPPKPSDGYAKEPYAGAPQDPLVAPGKMFQ